MVNWNPEPRQKNSKGADLQHTDIGEVPSFFVLSGAESKKVEESFFGSRSSPSSVDLEENFQDLGVEKDLRQASSRAKDLVQGQRTQHSCVVRTCETSHYSKPVFNVSENELVEAVAKCHKTASEHSGRQHRILVQKMVNAEFTAHIYPGYSNRKSLIEVVEGIGIPMENGRTKPTFILIDDDRSKKVCSPQKRATVRKNSRGELERTENSDVQITDTLITQLSDICSSLEQSHKAGKIVFDRSQAYVVDIKQMDGAARSHQQNTVFLGAPKNTDSLEDVEVPMKSQVSQNVEKGAYGSRPAQYARSEGIPMQISYNTGEDRDNSQTSDLPVSGGTSLSPDPVTKVKRIDGSFPPTDYELVGETKVLDRFDKAILDLRHISEELRALRVFSADKKHVAVNDPEDSTLREIVKQGFTTVWTSSQSLERRIEKQERKFALESARNSN